MAGWRTWSPGKPAIGCCDVPEPQSKRGWDLVPDQFDVTLIDSELEEELELITDLMIAANASADVMSIEAIDRILNVGCFYAEAS